MLEECQAYTLQEWLTHIGLHTGKIDLELERVKEVGNRGQLLSFSCPVVTVGGTNGKGSTVAILAKLLRDAGLNVGTYTSPHLLDFNERIQVNGKPVADEVLIDAFITIEKIRKDIPLTFFEFSTLAAFSIFQQHLPRLDVLILEVGLGGRLDAVNIVSPQIAVISSIDYDHQQFLGDTIEAIALEKAGIFRPDINVVLGGTAQISSLLAKAKEQHCKIWEEGKQFDYQDAKHWRFQGKIIELPKSNLPYHSLSIALATYEILRDNFLSLPEIGKITHFLTNMAMVARMQAKTYQGIELILDCGHNAQASKWLAGKLIGRSKRLFAIWASLGDKALVDIVDPFINQIESWYVPDLPDVARACPASDLSAVLKAQGAKRVTTYHTPQLALESAIKEADKDVSIVVYGSFYTVEKILSVINFDKRDLENNGLYPSKEVAQ